MALAGLSILGGEAMSNALNNAAATSYNQQKAAQMQALAQQQQMAPAALSAYGMPELGALAGQVGLENAVAIQDMQRKAQSQQQMQEMMMGVLSGGGGMPQGGAGGGMDKATQAMAIGALTGNPQIQQLGQFMAQQQEKSPEAIMARKTAEGVAEQQIKLKSVRI
jgi:hypothetical protein